MFEKVKKARGAKRFNFKRLNEEYYECIVNVPCIEGLLLTILGHSVPSISAQCKKQFIKIVGREAHQLRDRDWNWYFPKEILEAKATQIPQLQQLIRAMTDSIKR